MQVFFLCYEHFWICFSIVTIWVCMSDYWPFWFNVILFKKTCAGSHQHGQFCVILFCDVGELHNDK